VLKLLSFQEQIFSPSPTGNSRPHTASISPVSGFLTLHYEIERLTPEHA